MRSLAVCVAIALQVHVCLSARIMFTDWESGADGWQQYHEGVLIITEAQSTSPTHSQLLDRGGSGGNYRRNVPTVSGQTYCLSLWIKWVSGAAPYIGQSNSWEINADNGQFDRTTTEWRWHKAQFIAGGSSVQLDSEAFFSSWKAQSGDPTEVYFDDIAVTDGACVSDFCAMVQPCSNGGTCVAAIDGYTCSLPCNPNPCQHDGRCVIHDDQSTSCECAPGFAGANCEEDAATVVFNVEASEIVWSSNDVSITAEDGDIVVKTATQQTKLLELLESMKARVAALEALV